VVRRLSSISTLLLLLSSIHTLVADGAGGPAKLLLNENEVDEFEAVVEATIRTHARDFQEDRVAPGPDGKP